MNEPSVLRFPKLSRFDREREPVSVSIPWAQGRLRNSAHIEVRDEQGPLPLQVEVLGRWPDDSARWTLLHFQPDLPGNAGRDLRLHVEASARQPLPDQPVEVNCTAKEWRVNTGALEFRLRQGEEFALRQVELPHVSAWNGPRTVGTVEMRLAEPAEPLHPLVEKVELAEAGPLRAVLLLRGWHVGAEGRSDMAYRGRVTAYSGKTYVEVEHQFIHMGGSADLRLSSLTCACPEEQTSAARAALGEGYYRTGVETGPAVSKLIDAETLLYQANEHFTESFYGDFWADCSGPGGGLAVSHFQAHQHYPKSLRADAEGITAGLYPEGQEPARILQGMGRTHRLLLHFHAGASAQSAGNPGEEPHLQNVLRRSLQFQMPDVPFLDRSWYREHNPWGLDFFPRRVPGRLLSRFNVMHAARPQALGMMHFGDAPDAGYTEQGRGQGETVWVNNEYDRPHMSALYYGLTGQRRMLDSALVCARHWLDVDFCHKHADPLIEGGLKIHTAYHGTGGVVPSHEWTEGLLDYYFLTGRRDGLEAAESIGRNILRHLETPAMSQPGATAVREGGWALRAFVGLHLATGAEEWRRQAARIARHFVSWQREYNALLAPYTSHSMPRVPFMASITINSLARYLLLEDAADVKELIVDAVDDLLAHTLGPDGITFYKELPSLGRTAPTPHFPEALTHAFHITGDERYLQIAARQFAALTDRELDERRSAKFVDTGGAVISGKGGGRQFADAYSSMLLFAAAAAERGLLDWYEYPYADVAV